jgi:hypothetical protein
MRKIICLLSLFFCLATPTSRVQAAAVNEWDFNFESYLYGEQRELSNSSINPKNAVLQLPESSATWDNRLQARWLINDGKVILRPRWIGTSDKVHNDLEKKDQNSARGKWDLTDAFWEQSWNHSNSSTIGLQVYQWGPGELFNTSNPFFRFNIQQQTYTYKEKGQVLLRWNYSFSQETSLVLIAEPVSNNEPFYMMEKEFEPQAAIKLEKNWKGTRNYIGGVAGMEAQQNPFFGEYAHYEWLPGYSIYVDAKHSYELAYYGPTKLPTPTGYDMQLYGEDSGDWSHLALAGLRYEGDFDLRFEYLYNSLGYTEEEFKAAVQSASNIFSPNYAQNISRFLFSGLNLRTQHYAYFSLRVTEPFQMKDWTFSLRNLNSLTDQSGLVQGEFDTSIGGSLTIFGSYTYFFGDMNSEFCLLNDWATQLGLKYSL